MLLQEEVQVVRVGPHTVLQTSGSRIEPRQRLRDERKRQTVL